MQAHQVVSVEVVPLVPAIALCHLHIHRVQGGGLHPDDELMGGVDHGRRLVVQNTDALWSGHRERYIATEA